jgi:starch phosphorylase
MEEALHDPVCGMPVRADRSLVLARGSRLLHFCSPLCLREFLRDPAAFGERAGLRETPPAPTIAYFSMEVAADARIPSYSGGLGALAGDFLRACADLRLPVVGVTLLHRKGYFRQELDGSGRQTESEET